MATIEGLRATAMPAARWLVPPSGEGRDVAWVRLMRARIPAFDALESGDVAIASRAALAVVAPDEEAVVTLVRSAAEAGLAGLVLAGDTAGGGAAAADRVVEAARAAGLAVLDAGADDPVATERAAIEVLVRERAEIDRAAASLEGDLARIALAGGGVQEFAAVMAGQLGRPVAIEDARGEPLAVHAPPGVPGSAAAVAAYARRSRPAALRIPLAVAGGPPAIGALALLGETSPDGLERGVAGRIARFLALELARATGPGPAAGGREALPADGPPWVVIVARQIDPRGGGDPAPDASRREVVRRDLRAIAPARRMSLRGDALSVELRIVAAAPERDDHGGLVLAGRVARFLGRPVAVSRPFDDPAARSTAEAGARTTLEAVEALETPPAVARAERLPAYRLLAGLRHLPDGERQARALLAPLLMGRPDVRRERLATLRAVLDHEDVGEAAAALGVHRNTIAYRVRRIEEVTGWRLGDPDLRLPLSLAVRLVREPQDA